MSRTAPPNANAALARIDDQIAFVLEHPAMSVWIKQALTSALDRPPAEVLNDLEILNQILRLRSGLLTSQAPAGAPGAISDALR